MSCNFVSYTSVKLKFKNSGYYLLLLLVKLTCSQISISFVISAPKISPHSVNYMSSNYYSMKPGTGQSPSSSFTTGSTRKF